MPATRVLLELQRPSPRMPNVRVSWPRRFSLATIVDMIAFSRPGNSVLLELKGESARLPDVRTFWRLLAQEPGRLPLRLGVTALEGIAMAATSSRRVLLALDRPSPRMPDRGLSWRRRFGLAFLANAAAVAILVLFASGAALTRREARTPRAADSPSIVYISPPAGVVSGGGGGGGNRQSGPIPRALPSARVESPRVKPQPQRVQPQRVQPQRVERVEPTPAPPPLDARAVAATATDVAGLPGVDAVAAGTALGSGGPGGIGSGEGNGLGSGKGAGQGPGVGGGEGDGVYRLGSGVIAPVLVSQVRPNYTARALAQRLQGSVLLEVIVRRDGLPDAIRVVRSLDPSGLDDEAVRAVRQWRFRPGRVGPTPVDVLVTCIVDFSLR